MNEKEFLAEVQSLRQLIADNHGNHSWLALASYRNDTNAVRKFQAYFSRVFSSRLRLQRLQTLGILVGRELETSIGDRDRKGLTLGEVYAFLTWCDSGHTHFAIRKKAMSVLAGLRDNPALWGTLINKYLKPQTLEGVYAPEEPEEAYFDTAENPYQTHQGELSPSF